MGGEFSFEIQIHVYVSSCRVSAAGLRSRVSTSVNESVYSTWASETAGFQCSVLTQPERALTFRTHRGRQRGGGRARPSRGEGEGEGGRERKWPEPNRNSEGFEAEEQTESLKVGALRPNQRHTKAAFFTGPSMDALSSLKIHSRCRCAEKKGFWR